MAKVKWGVLGGGENRHREGYPGDATRRIDGNRRDRLARRGARQRRREEAEHPEGLWVLRGVAGRSGNRSDLQSAAERVAHSLDRARPRRGQACAVREADRARCAGSATADRGAGRLRQTRRRGLHGALPPAMASRQGDRALRRDWRDPGDANHVRLSVARRRKHPQQAAGGVARSTTSAATRF